MSESSRECRKRSVVMESVVPELVDEWYSSVDVDDSASRQGYTTAQRSDRFMRQSNSNNNNNSNIWASSHSIDLYDQMINIHSSSIDNDSELNDFIENASFTSKSIPMLEQKKHIYSIDEHPIPRSFFAYNLVIIIVLTIAFNSTICTNFFATINDRQTNKSDDAIILKYLFQRIMQLIINGSVLYSTITADTYKSVNYSLDILPINWVLYEYSITQTLWYLLILFVGQFMSAYITIGLFYSQIEAFDQEFFNRSIVEVDIAFAKKIDTFVLAFIVNAASSMITTIILGRSNSLNCKNVAMQGMFAMFIISLIYETTVGPMTFVVNRLFMYIAYVSVFGSTKNVNDILILLSVRILFRIIISPILVYYTKYALIPVLRKYLEYAT